MIQAIKLILILIVLLVLGAGAWYVMKLQSDNAILKANEATLQESISEQQEVIAQQQQDYEMIVDANKDLNNVVNKLSQEKSALQDKLKKHDLNYLATEKPGLVERVINKASAGVINDLETITSE